MTQETFNLILTALGTSLVTAFVNWLFNRRKSDAEEAKLRAETDLTVAKTAELLIKELKDAMSDVQSNAEKLQMEKIMVEKRCETIEEERDFFKKDRNELLKENAALKKELEQYKK